MKTNTCKLLYLLIFTSSACFAQTNTFPSSGNVGIGTLSPLAKLEVAGSIHSYNAGLGQLDNITSTKNYVNFSANNHGSVLISANLFISNNDDFKIANSHPTISGTAILMPGNSRPNQGAIAFYTAPVAAVTANSPYSGSLSMLIQPNGNVGIGTSDTKGYKLAVAGSLIAESVKVKLQGAWPDFVFEKTYKLPSLSDTEKHIKENGHLPGIPSAEDVRANGIELGDMNKKLLQKVEELTLYLIEMKKETEAYRKETQALRNNVAMQGAEIERLVKIKNSIKSNL
jgi:hypothetical protein